ncbi:peptidyl-prolyl cis-trans isomerase D [Spirosomataceae bacterium TFI 002]|nr:peptidyl-prolyl cis-trans isomerase D [Spirosomataceae bacterium TFI 002]
MALINKIRENSGLTIAVLAIALMAFIVGDYLSSGSLGGGGQEKIGSINGTDVDYTQFNTLVEAQRQQYEAQYGRSAGEQELTQIRSQVWEQLIQENAFQPEFKSAGIDVSPDELREMIQGAKNMHPYTKQQFTDPNTGLFNEEQHRQFITAAANKTLPLAQQAIWDQFKASLLSIRKAEKYQNLLTKTTYFTKADAKKEYEGQNTKLSANYLYVPFYSVNDTTVKVSDSQIRDYYSNHSDEFNPYDSRNIDYVAFQVVPSKEDSAAVRQDINTFARGLASATNAEAYANANSDIRTPYLQSAGDLSPEVKEAIAGGLVGAVAGPFKIGNNYSIYKYEGTERDSLYTAGASHILIRSSSTDPDSVQAAARAKALGVLAQLKTGADFATLARINSEDGSAQNGGDLGFFQNNGQMVKPFEDAIFSFNGTGLIPNLVKTDFGYHIIKVTEAKNNLRYKLATIVKVLAPSEATRNEFYQRADDLRVSARSLEDLKAKVAEDESLTLLSAQRIVPGAKNLNTLTNASEVIRWAYNEKTDVGDVSELVFEVDDSYIVAGLSAATDKEDPSALDFKDQIEGLVRNELKAETILAKLKGKTGTLEQIASAYGGGALVESVQDISFQTGMLNSPGLDPIALGTGFGLGAGKKKGPFVGSTGVFIMETSAVTKPAEIADYSQYKEELKQKVGQFASASAADQAIRDAAQIKDRRARMF